MNVKVETTPYEAIGGEAGIRQLVNRFYALMDELPEAYAVRKMHPDSLQGSAQSLFEFLSGWLGGPQLYVAKKGHPRLRMRHAPFAVDQAVHDEWMLCMTQTINEQISNTAFRDGLLATISQLARQMINTDSASSCQCGMPATA